MRALLVPLLLLAAMLCAGACTNVCSEASEVLGRCELDVAVDPGTAVDCSGEHAAFSQCLVDHPDAACDYYYDPVANEGNAFDLCVRAISGR